MENNQITKEDAFKMIKEVKEALDWLWENTQLLEDRKYLQSDYFNIPANALSSLDRIEDYIFPCTHIYCYRNVQTKI